jgi:hypothetical protein
MFFEMNLGLSLSFRVRTVKRGAGNGARRSKIISVQSDREGTEGACEEVMG